MKLTPSQRADYLARFVAAAISNTATPEDAFVHGQQTLALYEAEIAKWPDESPTIAYGPATIRNPENIDLVRYPPPPGYTVASEEDVAAAPNDACWAFFTNGWVINTPHSAGDIHNNWTYLRPLREGEVAQ